MIERESDRITARLREVRVAALVDDSGAFCTFNLGDQATICADLSIAELRALGQAMNEAADMAEKVAA